MRINPIIGTAIRPNYVLDQIVKWKSRCYVFTALGFLAGLSLGLYVSHTVLN